MNYYIISLKHTGKNDRFITLWRPDNAGYCWFKENAGLYDGYEKGYHDSCNNLPVPEEVANLAFSAIEYEGSKVTAILNTLGNRKILGIKKTQLGKFE